MKKGQAFLITAVIFIAIVSAFITIHNSSKKTEFSTFPFVAEEIQIESEKVMDYALVKDDFNSIDTFTDDVSKYVDKENIDIYFIEDSSGSLKFYNSTIDLTSDLTINSNIIATLENTNYLFPLNSKGKHFYFIMIKEKEVGGEKYVYTNA
ncbi:hypothetical protein HYS72_02935 [Candidatus Pacearchaeota archaeon]|nr:hypothetical protein [Candidatus Pacearchaeota archaeon]MBI2056841.1 hypothetical protein [Candidatus Pacearchaeota archaeon]